MKDGPKSPPGRSGDCSLSNMGLAHESQGTIAYWPESGNRVSHLGRFQLYP